MKTILLVLLLTDLELSLLSCQELQPITLKTSVIASLPSCIPPSIDNNIIGTWHFESTALAGSRTGSLTFDARYAVVDPDSLFETALGSSPVVVKSYFIGNDGTYPTYSGKLFEVYVQAKNTTRQIYYFVITSNECNRIVLTPINNQGSHMQLILTR